MKNLFNTKPDYQSLKAFGFLYFPCLRPNNSHKLDFKSAPCTFLGYAIIPERICVFEQQWQDNYIRCVVFNEQVYPFTQATIKTTQKVYNPKVSIPIKNLHKDKVFEERVEHAQNESGPKLTMSDFRSGHGQDPSEHSTHTPQHNHNKSKALIKKMKKVTHPVLNKSTLESIPTMKRLLHLLNSLWL